MSLLETMVKTPDIMVLAPQILIFHKILWCFVQIQHVCFNTPLNLVFLQDSLVLTISQVARILILLLHPGMIGQRRGAP